MRGLHQEGAALFRWSADNLRESSQGTEEERQRMLALTLAFEGECLYTLSYEKARALVQDSVTIMRRLPTTKETLHAIHIWGELFAVNEAERVQIKEEVLNIARATNYGWWVPKFTVDFAHFAMNRGDYDQAESLLQEAFAVCRETSDPGMTVYILLALSRLANCRGNYPEARRVAQEGLSLAQEIGYSSASLWTSSLIADNALLQGDYAAAYSHNQTSLILCQEQEDQLGLVFRLSGLGSSACGLGNYREACQHFHDALRIATEMSLEAAQLDVIGATAWLLNCSGQAERAAERASYVLTHPGSCDFMRRRLTHLLEDLETVLPSEVFMTAVERGKTLELDKTVVALLEELSQTLSESAHVHEQSAIPLRTDVLTERELEVLRLIAEGLSNYDIAVRLFLGVSTIKTHVNRIFSKLCAKNRTQAVARARELHLI